MRARWALVAMQREALKSLTHGGVHLGIDLPTRSGVALARDGCADTDVDVQEVLQALEFHKL